jgi:GMP synthase-like glutamine amidotransferase
MRRFLVVVPKKVAPAALVGEVLVERGAVYDTIMPADRFASHAPFTYPGLPERPGDYAGLVVMGGGMSANDDAEHPFVADLRRLVRAFDAAGRPVLGVCLGAQIVARAYGGTVYRMARFESGLGTVDLTAAAREDPVFAGLPAALPVFHNHYEAVRDMVGATVLAANAHCPIQAFRVGARVYGLQFHPEVTIDTVREWIRVFGARFCQDEPRLLTDLDRTFAEGFAAYRAAGRALIGRWAALAT